MGIKFNKVRQQLFSLRLKLIVGNLKKNMGIAPTLSQYGLNLRMFTQHFESYSFYIKNGFEVSCRFNVSGGKISGFVIYEPSSSFYIKNFFLYKEVSSLSSKDRLKLIYEISKIKSNRESLKSISLYSLCKMNLSVLKSFN